MHFATTPANHAGTSGFASRRSFGGCVSRACINCMDVLPSNGLAAPGSHLVENQTDGINVGARIQFSPSICSGAI